MTQLKRRHHRKTATLELTPLVDVSLMLVVFLLLSSGMVAPEDQHIPIDLPATGSGEAGRLLLSFPSAPKGRSTRGRVPTLDQLDAVVGDDREAVVIRADRKAEHGRSWKS